MEILTRDEFWKRTPAPGTKFLEIADSICEVSANPIEPELDEPDEITMIKISRDKAPVDADQILVISWGSWEGHEELLTQHNEAVVSIEAEGYPHECALGIQKPDADPKAKKTVKKTSGPKSKTTRG